MRTISESWSPAELAILRTVVYAPDTVAVFGAIASREELVRAKRVRFEPSQPMAANVGISSPVVGDFESRVHNAAAVAKRRVLHD